MRKSVRQQRTSKKSDMKPTMGIDRFLSSFVEMLGVDHKLFANALTGLQSASEKLVRVYVRSASTMGRKLKHAENETCNRSMQNAVPNTVGYPC